MTLRTAGIDVGSSAIKVALLEDAPGAEPRILARASEWIRRREPQQVATELNDRALD